jgi:eukaryotic-like serine/threonine-protein kinase
VEDGVDRAGRPAKTPDSLPTRFSVLLRDLAKVPEPAGGPGWERVLHPGAVIGRFELVREVGRGGFGRVYEARDGDLGRTVAFKAVLPGGDIEQREERLLQEAEAAARLSHPNIVTLFDVDRSEQGLYLILEFLRGQTLARRMEQGPMPAVEALRIALEVAKGIAHAHAHGVVHRDLSTGNVFLCEDGQVKVLDLGMAHAFGRRRIEGGTPGFMAPEQRRGAPEDERTDVFALGVVLYKMLSRELPFGERGADGEAHAPVLDVPEAPGLGEVVARMLEPDAVARPRDAVAVVAELGPFLRELERTPSSGSLVPARRRRRRLGLAGAVTAIGLVVAGAAMATGWPTLRSVLRLGPGPAPSIAVLPFANVSPDRGEDYFADGLSDEILNALARIEGLRVPGRSSSFFFKDKNVKLEDVGKQLNVATVLEGSVRKIGNRVRVSAEIVNVDDGRRLWSQTYDRELTDIFAVQDEIAVAVVDALHVRLLGGTSQSPSSVTTANAEAYTQYLLGKEQYLRRTRESLARSVAAFEKATSLDPGYAPAWAGIGIPLYLLYAEGETAAEVKARHRRALAAAEKAVALAPDLPDALSTRGYLRAAVDDDWAGATADLQRAIALNANDADARRRYGILLLDLGRLPEAVKELRRAVEIDPLGQSWTTLGVLEQGAGDLAAAEAAFRRQVKISPESIPGQVGLGRTLVLASKPKEALEVFAQVPEDSWKLWGRAAAAHSLGDRKGSQEALEALLARHAPSEAVLIAEVFAWRGEKEAALDWLEQASILPAGEVRSNPFFRGLHGEARFKALLRKLKLPVE